MVAVYLAWRGRPCYAETGLIISMGRLSQFIYDHAGIHRCNPLGTYVRIAYRLGGRSHGLGKTVAIRVNNALT